MVARKQLDPCLLSGNIRMLTLWVMLLRRVHETDQNRVNFRHNKVCFPVFFVPRCQTTSPAVLQILLWLQQNGIFFSFFVLTRGSRQYTSSVLILPLTFLSAFKCLYIPQAPVTCVVLIWLPTSPGTVRCASLPNLLSICRCFTVRLQFHKVKNSREETELYIQIGRSLSKNHI